MRDKRAVKFLFLLAALCIGWGAYAHAGRVTVRNNTEYDIKMAFKFYDYEKKEWVVWGWYSVPAGAKKSFTFKIAPDRKVYWYGKTEDGKRHWPGQGDHGQSVINKKMDGLKAATLRTYAGSKVVKFRSRDANAEGDLNIGLGN